MRGHGHTTCQGPRILSTWRVLRPVQYNTGCLKDKSGIALSLLCPVIAWDSVQLTQPALHPAQT
jgi:hypothetical protein